MLNKLLKQVERTESESNANNSKSYFCFDKVIPQPDNVDWYSWRIDNWDTKWNASDVSFGNDTHSSLTPDYWEEGSIKVFFNTAWSPPIKVIDQLSKDNPKVKIEHTFLEEGMGFFGTYIYKNGLHDIVEEGSDISSAECSIKDKYLGMEHHWCSECNNEVECLKENTKDLCETCLEQQESEDKQLWEEGKESA
jgi:hypothetical protein